MEPREESELLAACRKGDTDAWNELFDRFYGGTARFVSQLGYEFSLEDVEEICQEVFLSVIKNLPGFQQQCQFQTWLFRIASNKARDWHQQRMAAKRGGGKVTLSLQSQDPETGDYWLDPPSPVPPPDMSLLHTENLGLVGQALIQLGGPCQEILELRYFADLSYEEIAKALDLKPKTVSSRLSKCLDKLARITQSLISGEKKTKDSV